MRARWTGVAVAFALVVLVLFLARGDEPAPEREPEPMPGPGGVKIPLPKPPPPKPLAEQARGVYVIQSPKLKVTLNLLAGRRFLFFSSLDGRERKSSGTWSLSGNRLTLAYMQVTGRPEITPENPTVVTNVWRGNTVELTETGYPGRVVLIKRTMMREK